MNMMEKDYTDIFLSASALDRLNLFLTIKSLRRGQLPIAAQIEVQRREETLVQEVNLRQIATLTGRNYGSIYNIYNDLADTLHELTGAERNDIPRLFAVSQGRLRFKLIEREVPFQFLQAVLSRKFPNFTAFVAYTGKSKMTVLRHLKPLRALAEHFSVRLSAEKMTFTGDERHVRLFLTMVFWVAANGADWPFAELSHAQVAQQMGRVFQLLEYDVNNPVSREVAYYYYVINLNRIKHGHVLQHDQQKLVLDYPLPNVFKVLKQEFPAQYADIELSTSQQIGETEYLFFLTNFAPIYITKDEGSMDAVLARYKRYNPALYHLVSEFLAKFPGWGTSNQLQQASILKMIQVNFFAITASTLTLGSDFSYMVAYAFNQTVRQMPPDPAFEGQVKQTLETLVMEPDLRQFEPLLPALTATYYQTLRQIRGFFENPVELKVALAMEQTMSGYIDLLAMLMQQSFVELVPSEGAQTPDLMIYSSALSLPECRARGTVLFSWPITSSSDNFGNLFATMYQLWEEKVHLTQAPLEPALAKD